MMKKDTELKCATPMKLKMDKMLVTKKKYGLNIFMLFSFILSTNLLNAQSIKILTTATKTSLRGLSVVSDKVIWASGSSGMVALSLDSGNSFKWISVSGYEKTEFRDIEAFDDKTAIIMGIDSPGIILKTTDAGNNWKVVYKNNTKGIFLDAMDFVNNKNGIVIGDPINGIFFIATTNDAGESWQVDTVTRILAASGEAAFASSGSNVIQINKKDFVLISGGVQSHFFKKNIKYNIPIIQGKESTGANAVAYNKQNTFIIVGGDFNTKDSTKLNCCVSNDGGKNWSIPNVPPTGYRSGIAYVYDKTWVTCGLNGIDISDDNGMHFSQISKLSFNVCKTSKTGKLVFFAGNNGKIAKFL